MMNKVAYSEEYWEVVRVSDVVEMGSYDVLSVNGVQFEPDEKLCDLGDGTLGILTGMTRQQFKQELVREVLSRKIDEHLRYLARNGCYVALIGKLFAKVWL